MSQRAQLDLQFETDERSFLRGEIEQGPWLASLKKFVEEKPLVIVRFTQAEWETLRESRRGVNEFTFARAHYQLEGVIKAWLSFS
jgi:hypothetical protein